MKLQKAIRMQLVLAGLGATLLMGSAARAQQEVDPTMFGEGSANSQVYVSSAAQKARLAGTESKIEKQAAAPLTIPAAKDATLEANVSRMMAEEVAIFATLLVGIAAIVLYAAAATRREGQLQVSSGNASYSTVTRA
jgi:hypothetical protein